MQLDIWKEHDHGKMTNPKNELLTAAAEIWTLLGPIIAIQTLLILLWVF